MKRLLIVLTICALAFVPRHATVLAASPLADGDSIVVADTLLQDTTAIDTVKTSNNALDQPVEYTAKDSIVFDMSGGKSKATLYGDGKMNYTNLELEAAIITMNMDNSVVNAWGRADSTGVIEGKPVFKQGGDTYEPDSMAYNFKSRKAFVHNVYTEQGEGFLISSESKRDSSGTMFIRRGMYTTCDEAHPHFYLALTRAKVHPGKKVIFGPAYLVLEDVPLPLAIPYGFFPFTDSYSSGIIMPTFGDEMSRGFYLREGGYYWAINDKIDLKLLGEIYTKGSWGLSAQSTYKKRYKYSGNVFLSYLRTVDGDKGLPDYSVTKSYKIQWTHRQDSKANPSQSLSASVNFASTSYERNNLTSMYNPETYTQSTRTSSVSYSKTFSKIGLTLAFTGNMSQNMRDSTIALTLPSLNISLQRFYPFKRKKMVGKERWYEKISMSYTGTLSNSINTKENLLLKSNLIKDWKNGMRHQIPVSASFTILDYINVTSSFNFTDRTYFDRVNRRWDNNMMREVCDTTYGFYNVYNYNMSLSATTKLYGLYRPLVLKNKISAIRHVLTPTLSLSYAPDFSTRRFGFYDTYVKTDADGNVSTVEYSPYSGGMYGTVSKGKTGSLSFDVANNLEMKLRTDKDSTGTKKVSLIDELGASMSYNMAAKSKPWSDLSMRVRLKLTKSYTFSLNAVFATYAYEFDENGNVRVGDRTEYSHGRFGRFQGMSQNLSYTFNNSTFTKLFGRDKDKDSKGSKGVNAKSGDDDDEDDDEELTDTNIDPDRKKAQQGAKRSDSSGGTDADGYMKFSLPWSFTVSYGVTMRENTQAKIREKRMRYPYKLTHTMNFSGNLRISEGWNISFSSGYDFNYKQLSMTTASLSRDLHCFSMSASVVLRPYMSYNFNFQAKASALTDVLKWKKSSSYGSNIEWY